MAMARAQQRGLPHVRARYYADDGHLIFFSRIGEILADLAAPWTSLAQVSHRLCGSPEISPSSGRFGELPTVKPYSRTMTRGRHGGSLRDEGNEVREGGRHDPQYGRT